MDLREKRIILYLILIAGVVSVPLMTDYLMTSSSLASELSHIEVISREIGKVFPVRVGSWGSMDYGYSAASFQSNMCYLLPALLRLAGMGLGNAYKWTLFLYHLGTAVTAYVCFTKCFEKRDAGLLASILYTWCPYRLSEIYLVGDVLTVDFIGNKTYFYGGCRRECLQVAVGASGMGIQPDPFVLHCVPVRGSVHDGSVSVLHGKTESAETNAWSDREDGCGSRFSECVVSDSHAA